MNKFTKGLLLVAGMMPGALFAQKTVTVDVKANVHTISPYIYGTNEAYENSTATRWGGNRSTSYNWETNASNSGNDYSFTSDNFFDVLGTGNNSPAYPIMNAVKTADKNGQYSLVSLQAAGYVAADMDGVVSEKEIAPSSRWKPISFHKTTPYSLTPDADDDTVYIDELINYLSVKLGKAGDGGVSAYAIDNEPYLWNSTHNRMHPEKTTPEEIVGKTADLASVIRTIAPTSEIFGPMFFGWSDAYRWGMDNTQWKQLRKLSEREGYSVKYNWFVDYYLDTLQKYEEKTGIRPIDAIAFHWYPEAYGEKTKMRIINVESTDNVSSADLVAEDMVEARLQAPRALWDSKFTYKDGNGDMSYVCTGSAVVYNQVGDPNRTGYAFIPKIKESIKNFYPGTKIAFTEFEYDAEDHWSGGLCLVDVLGVFGKEDVYLACKWDVFKRYSLSAYNLYLNYDGAGSTFGTTSVAAQQSDTAALSSFASLDEKGNLHIMVVNKTNEAQNIDFSIANGLYSDGVAYGFGEGSSAITKLDDVEKIENQSFVYIVPAHFAVHLILNKVPQTELVSAKISSEVENKLALSFNDNLTLISSEKAAQEFSVLVDGVETSVTTVSVENNNAMLTLPYSITSANKDIRVSYNGNNLIGMSQLPVEFFDTVYVYNELANAELFVRSISINKIGTEITASVSRQISGITNNGGIQLKLGNENIAIDSVKISPESNYEFIIYPSNRIVRYVTTVISTKDNAGIFSLDGVALSDFSISVVGGANYAPKVDSVILEDNYTVRLYFDSNMNPDCDFANAGFVLHDNLGNSIPFTCEYKKSAQVLVFKTEEAMSVGIEYYLSYNDAGKVSTIHDGILDSFTAKLDNQLKDMGAVLVVIPGVIQGEQYWSCVGDPIVEDCSDTSSLGNGNHLGYISVGDKYVYKISVPESKNYTVTVRYASESNGDLNFVIDGVAYHLTLPSTKGFKKWKEVYRVVPLTEGEHEITMEILSAGYNVNYIQFTDEEKYPVATISKVQIPISGNIMNIYFSTNIDILPEPEEITLMCNDTIQIPISGVELNSSAVVKCLLDTTIYIGSKLSLRFASPTFLSADGGSVHDTTLVVTNKSTQIYKAPDPKPLAVDELYVGIKVSPIPAQVGQPIVLSSDREVAYKVITTNGAFVEQGVCDGEITITIAKEGVYSIIVTEGDSTIVKKIIVR
ncbi:MAG: carbohydrate-binding protein [Bacteroidales bacterium]|nr:carbohydrate-binding protein [Bacteroidales bacterium]